jgi:hypothetical protein
VAALGVLLARHASGRDPFLDLEVRRHGAPHRIVVLVHRLVPVE